MPQQKYEIGKIKNFSLNLSTNTHSIEDKCKENRRYRNKSQDLAKSWNIVDEENANEKQKEERKKMLKSTEFYNYMLEFYDKQVNRMNMVSQ